MMLYIISANRGGMKHVIDIDAKSDKGKLRNINEDSFIIINNAAYHPFETIAVVADGLGGENAGEMASKIATETIRDYFNFVLERDIEIEKIQIFFKDAILKAHKKIIEHALTHSNTRGMATTIVIAGIVQDDLYVSWVGDSRCYHYTKENGLQQITQDHSYVQQLIDAGQLTKREAAFHPMSHVITQSVGSENKKPNPGFSKTKLHDGDVILLCTDGLTNMLADEDIANIIEKNRDDISLCNHMLIAAANEAGGTDNITNVLIKVNMP